MNSQRTPRITVYGNLGADPETRNLKGRTITKEFYDFTKDEAVVREHTIGERQIRTASLAVKGRNEHDEEITRWHRLVDFEEHLATFHKGDRLKVTGYFRASARSSSPQKGPPHPASSAATPTARSASRPRSAKHRA